MPCVPKMHRIVTLVSRCLHQLTFSMASAVFTGTVDFSTTILLLVDTDAIMRAAPSLSHVDKQSSAVCSQSHS